MATARGSVSKPVVRNGNGRGPEGATCVCTAGFESVITVQRGVETP
jgi:hypothetical protein